jgi:hypothetical protein
MQMFLEDMKDVRPGTSMRVVAGITRGDWKSLTFDTKQEVTAVIIRIRGPWAAFISSFLPSA